MLNSSHAFSPSFARFTHLDSHGVLFHAFALKLGGAVYPFLQGHAEWEIRAHASRDIADGLPVNRPTLRWVNSAQLAYRPGQRSFPGTGRADTQPGQGRISFEITFENLLEQDVVVDPVHTLRQERASEHFLDALGQLRTGGAE